MRAIDAKIIEELEMLYGDKDSLASLQDWFGTAETYWINLQRLFIIADYTEKQNSDAVKEINHYRQKIVEDKKLIHYLFAILLKKVVLLI